MLEKMIQIVLWLLAFLGITLLVILGIILLLFVLLLFVPIRYRGDFSKDGGTMALRIKVSWLLRLIRVRADYEKELLIQAYVLFFKVFDSGKPARERKRSKRETVSKKEKSSKKEKFSEKDSDIEDAFKAENPSMAPSTAEITSETQNADAGAAHSPKEENEDFPQSAPKQTLLERFREKIRNILCKIKGICDKIKYVVNNIQYYLKLLREDDTKVLFKGSMSRLLKILKSIRPRKLETELVIGTGSPDTTGYVMALAGMLYPYFGRHVNIEPDFEKTIFEGKILVKGRVTIFVLLWQALKIYRDKDLRAFLGKLKREDA